MARGPDHPGSRYRTDDAYDVRTTEESYGNGIARREYSWNREDGTTFLDGPAKRGDHGHVLDHLDRGPSGRGGGIGHESDVKGVSDVRGFETGEKDEGQVRSTQDILSLFG